MKKAVYSLGSLLILSLIWLVIYWNLPFEITRKKDLELGNTLIENIQSYKSKHHKIPDENDSSTLRKLGFKMGTLGTEPSYETNQNGEYEVVFTEGFDGPYLMWNSKDEKWKMDFPAIYH